MTQMNLSRKQKQTHRHREQTCGRQGGGEDWELGISRCKLVYIGWINNKVLLYSTGYYIQYPISCIQYPIFYNQYPIFYLLSYYIYP